MMLHFMPAPKRVGDYDVYYYAYIQLGGKIAFKIANFEKAGVYGKLTQLKDGEYIEIKGLGKLKVVGVYLDEEKYDDYKVLYREIKIDCDKVVA